MTPDPDPPFGQKAPSLSGSPEAQERGAANLAANVLEALPIGVTVQNRDGRFLFANQAAADALGVARESLIGVSPSDFLSAAEAAERRVWERNVLTSRKAIVEELFTCGPSANRAWLAIHSSACTEGDTVLLSTFTEITEQKLREDELSRKSHVDPLTGLPQRELFAATVEQRIRERASNGFALAFLDVDHFKQVNDFYSHAIGDALLVAFSKRVCACLGPNDLLARVSGDEFVLLIDEQEDASRREGVASKILNAIREPFFLEGFEIFSSCSLGISRYPEDARSYETLRRQADTAMYHAKHGAKGTAVFFDAKMAETATARMASEQRLRLAIRDEKFCCAFQPKVEIQSHDVIGFEALVRWRDDDGDIHPPGDFVDIAAELGLLNPITTFVAQETLRSIPFLDQSFGPNTSFSINLTPKQGADREFMLALIATLKASGYERRVILELTEEAFLQKGVFQREILPLLREVGIRISIDDFGTGHSSLSTLADITADEIKIDRSFITAIHQRPRSQSVLRTIESLGQALGMTLVAEGVETYEELAYLMAATKIRYVQGFYFSKPLYLEELSQNAPNSSASHSTSRAHTPSRPNLGRVA
jgi:cyclic di-GMP phosphodiesterase Gmr